MTVPSFILVGAPKCGTSFLLQSLRQNPCIFLPPTNELYFHSKLRDTKGPYDKGLKNKITQTYEDYTAYFNDSVEGQVVGEIATDYLYHSSVSAKSIAEHCGVDVKILVVLRNPIERTISNYRHMLSKGHETLEFRDAINAQSDRRNRGWRWSYQYAEISKYFDNLKDYIDVFENVKVILFEDIQRDRLSVLRSIEAYLNVPSYDYVDLEKRRNVKLVYKNRVSLKLATYLRRLSLSIGSEVISDKFDEIFSKGFEDFSTLAYKELFDYFTDDIERLEQLLGRDLNAWKYHSD